MVAITLGLYWAPAFLITSRHVEASHNAIVLAVALFVFGIVLMIGSDAQKTLTLQVRKGLITTAFFQLCRNPNYLVREISS